MAEITALDKLNLERISKFLEKKIYETAETTEAGIQINWDAAIAYTKELLRKTYGDEREFIVKADIEKREIVISEKPKQYLEVNFTITKEQLENELNADVKSRT